MANNKNNKQTNNAAAMPAVIMLQKVMLVIMPKVIMLPIMPQIMLKVIMPQIMRNNNAQCRK